MHHNFDTEAAHAEVTQRLAITVNTGSMGELEFASAIFAKMAPLFAPGLTNSAQYTLCRIQRLKPTPVLEEVTSDLPPVPGTGGTTPAASQLAGLISLRSGNAGRKYRGRRYIPFPDDGFVVGSPSALWSGAYKSILQGIAVALVGVQTYTSGALSIQATNVVSDKAFTTGYTLNSFVIREAPATQRRRGLVRKFP